MKQTILLFALLFLMLSCGGTDSGEAIPEELPNDSAQLRIGVMPTLDCMPIYVAHEKGLFEQAGIDVSLFEFQAQMDCDTAIQRGRVNVVVSDLVRVLRMNDEQQLDLKLVASTELFWQLLTARNARVKQLKQLDNKTLAMTRFSATHLLSQLAVDSATVARERVFLIQVNDVDVRLNMLQNEIIDAVWLTEPQATDARMRRAQVLLDTRRMNLRLGVVAFRKGAATVRQVDAFKKAYNQACDSLNELGVHHYADLLERRCHATQQMIDSLPGSFSYHHAQAPFKADIERAEQWLKQNKPEKHAEK